IVHKEVTERKPIVIREAEALAVKPLHEKAKTERTIIVELDTPRHLDTTKFLEGSAALNEAGVDAVTMADNSLASPRISNMAMGSILKHKQDIRALAQDRKSTRLNSSHVKISYAVFCLKKKKK